MFSKKSSQPPIIYDICKNKDKLLFIYRYPNKRTNLYQIINKYSALRSSIKMKNILGKNVFFLTINLSSRKDEKLIFIVRNNNLTNIQKR